MHLIHDGVDLGHLLAADRISAGEIFQANIARRWRGELVAGAKPSDLAVRLARDSEHLWLLTARQDAQLAQNLVHQLAGPGCRWEISRPQPFGTLSLYRLQAVRR